MKRQFKLKNSGNRNLLLYMLEAHVNSFIDSQIKGIGDFDPKLRDDYIITILVEGSKAKKERLKRSNTHFGKRLGGNKNGI